MKASYILILLLLQSIFFSCKGNEQVNPIYGNWSAKYIYLGKNELLGYGESKISYSLKPAIFNEDGRMVILKNIETKERIEANFKLLTQKSLDSIEIESDIDMLDGRYKIELQDENGKVIMLFKARNKEMYFERIMGRVSY